MNCFICKKEYKNTDLLTAIHENELKPICKECYTESEKIGSWMSPKGDK